MHRRNLYHRVIQTQSPGSIDDSVATQKVDTHRDHSLTLEQAMEYFKSFPDKTAYFVSTEHQGIMYYGLDVNSSLIQVPQKVHEALGSPEEDVDVPVFDILKAADMIYKF